MMHNIIDVKSVNIILILTQADLLLYVANQVFPIFYTNQITLCIPLNQLHYILTNALRSLP